MGQYESSLVFDNPSMFDDRYTDVNYDKLMEFIDFKLDDIYNVRRLRFHLTYSLSIGAYINMIFIANLTADNSRIIFECTPYLDMSDTQLFAVVSGCEGPSNGLIFILPQIRILASDVGVTPRARILK